MSRPGAGKGLACGKMPSFSGFKCPGLSRLKCGGDIAGESIERIVDRVKERGVTYRSANNKQRNYQTVFNHILTALFDEKILN